MNVCRFSIIFSVFNSKYRTTLRSSHLNINEMLKAAFELISTNSDIVRFLD